MDIMVFSLHCDSFPDIRLKKIVIYRLAYSIAIYCNISNCNPILIHIVLPDSFQYTALLVSAPSSQLAANRVN